MTSIRYVLAVTLLVTIPPVLLFWLLIHTFVRLWRRLGHRWTLGLVGVLMAGVMVGLFLVRQPLLATEFGTRPLLIALGLACLAGAMVILLQLKQRLPLQTLVGLPELAPDRHSGMLLTAGIYARLRHPRYVQMVLALLGYTLIANYLATYVLWALCLLGVYLIVLLEERELRDRFGEAYDEYCYRVPRFMPRSNRSSRTAGSYIIRQRR